MKRPELVLAAVGLIAAPGCRDLDTTSDGTPIVRLEPDVAPTESWESAGVRLRFDLELWTNRMPGPVVPRRDSSGGFRLHAALRVDVAPGPEEGRIKDVRIPALTLWSPRGDTLVAAFALTQTDGAAPLLASDSQLSSWELIDDRDRPRYTNAPPEALCRPLLLVEVDGHLHRLRLRDARIMAVY